MFAGLWSRARVALASLIVFTGLAHAAPTMFAGQVGQPQAQAGYPFSYQAGQAVYQAAAWAAGEYHLVTCAFAGNPPPGLVINSSPDQTLGTLCYYSGTPTQVGVFDFSIQLTRVSDNAVGYAEITATITPPDIALSPAAGTLAAATRNIPYSRLFSGGNANAPYTYGVTSGTLPAGLSLSPTTGLLSGTPTSAAGTYNFTISATDSTAGTGAPFSKSQAYSLQLNDEPTISINDVSAPEGDSGTTPFVFTVSLSGPSTGAVTVNYATANNTAMAGSDYTAASGTLTFAPGETSKTITVLVTGDTIYENTQDFFVNLSGATNATIADGQGVGTILNNDGSPPLAINDVTASEAAGTMTFTVTRTGATELYSTVKYATANGTAVSPGDYTATSGTLTFPASLAATSTQTFTVALTDDNVYEAAEQFVVNLSNPFQASFSDSQGIGTITDNDPAPTLAVNDVSVSEGAGNAIFTVTLTGATALPIAVNYVTADGTAVSPGDYSATSGTLTFNPSTATSQTLTIVVPLNNDATNEATEQFALNLSGPTNGATLSDAQGVATITDDDAVPTLSINDVSAAEGNSGTTAFTFTVSLTGATAQTATVNYATADGTATAGSDYAAVSGTLTFAPGETSKTITVLVNGDYLVEANETFFLNLSGPTNATITDNQGVATINNDDTAVQITQTTVPGGQVGIPYSQQLAATGGDGGPYSFTFAPSLPPGLTLTSAGLLSGTPTAQGNYGVTVTATDGVGNTGQRSYTIFIQQALPTIASLTPTFGPTAGGTVVTITGTNLTGASAVTFGGTAASFTVNSATSITATTPAHAAGAVNVAVTTPGGTATATNGYTYQAPGAVRFVINNPDDGSYVFTSPTAALNFTVATSGGTGSSANIPLAPGSYAVSFTTPAGTGFASASCAPTTSSVNTSARTASLVIASNVTTVCTIEALPSRRATVEAIGAALDVQSRLILSNAPTLSRRLDRLNGGGSGGMGSASAFGKTLASNLPFSTEIGMDTARFSMSLSGLRAAGNADHRFHATANENGVPASLAASAAPASGLAATAVGAAAMGDGSGPRFDVWVEGLIARFDAAANSDGDFAIIHAGADYLVTPNLLIGVGIQGDWLNMDTSTGSLDSSGWLAGPYLTARIADGLYLDARAAWGGATFDVSPFGTYTDQVDSDRALYTAALIGEFSFGGNLSVRPEARVSWYKETTDAYVDSLSVAIPSVEIRTGEVTFGPTFEWSIKQASGAMLVPSIGLDLIWTFQQDNTATAFTNAPGLDDTGVRGRIEAGLAYESPEGISLGASLFYDGIGGGDYDAWGGKAALRFGF